MLLEPGDTLTLAMEGDMAKAEFDEGPEILERWVSHLASQFFVGETFAADLEMKRAALTGLVTRRVKSGPPAIRAT
jgi:hypothetical protein